MPRDAEALCCRPPALRDERVMELRDKVAVVTGAERARIGNIALAEMSPEKMRTHFAIENDCTRQLIGRDAHLLGALCRLSPHPASRRLQAMVRRQRGRG